MDLLFNTYDKYMKRVNRKFPTGGNAFGAFAEMPEIYRELCVHCVFTVNFRVFRWKICQMAVCPQAH